MVLGPADPDRVPRNRVLNASFEGDRDGDWIPDQWTADRGARQDGTAARSGSTALRLEGEGSAYQYFELEPGAQFSISACVRGQGVVGRGVRLKYVQVAMPPDHIRGRVNLDFKLESGERIWVDDLELRAAGSIRE